MGSNQPFPSTCETVAPNPTSLWGNHVRKPPHPTNSAWLNYVLNNGEQPEYIHPFLVQVASGGVTVCYPSRAVQPAFILQPFVRNFTVSCTEVGNATHSVSHFDDISVTLELAGRIKIPLVRGSPYVTFLFNDATPFFSTIHAVLGVWANADNTKHKITLNNGQVWLIYASCSLRLSGNLSCAGRFTGVVRVSVVAGAGAEAESILDRYSTCYPVHGSADLSVPFQVHYSWRTEGWGELLMLSLPVHREILGHPSEKSRISLDLFNSIDGPLQGVVGSRWTLQEKSISVGWYSSKGVADARAREQIAAALEKDASELSPIQTPSTYFHGKALARAARLALIAEEISCFDVVSRVRNFLVTAITPWLTDTFAENAVLYDTKWGGLISQQGAKDPGADFGLAMYNDHHYHWGYFVYAGAVLAKLDPAWGHRFKPHLYAFVHDYMSLDPVNGLYPRLRTFDPWVLHSWAGGLVEFADGRNQESTSEAVHAYYAAYLLGMAYGDSSLINTGATLATLESRSARVLWHIPSWTTLYEPEFVAGNKVVGVLWANKRDTGLWFAGAECKECRLGIQLLPLCPITEHLFQDTNFVRELVDWTLPSLSRESVTDGWRGFVYALQAIYDPVGALTKVASLASHDDGNSLSNLLWWIHSRVPCVAQ